MKQKLISIFTAFCLSAVLFIPAYAEEPIQPDEVIIPDEFKILDEVIIPVETAAVVTLPQPTFEPEILETSETTNTNGVISTPRADTPQGNGRLLEDVNDYEVSRQFITVQSKGGHVFYIIIDNERGNENVYFLNAVDDFDLLSFSENFPVGVLEGYEELKEEAARLEAERAILENQGEDGKITAKSEEPVTEEVAKPNTTNYILIGVAVLFLGGLVYFKFFKEKGGVKAQSQDEEDDTFEDNYEENRDEIQDEIQEPQEENEQ